MAPTKKSSVSKTEKMPKEVAKKVVKKAVEPKTEPVVEEPAPVTTETPLAVLEAKLALLTTALKDVMAQVKIVKKDNDRLRRISERVERKRANARTTPNGFAKPTKISDELCSFLGVPSGTEKARTDVTREIHKFVKENNLSDEKNKRIILAHKNPTLKKLLNCTEKDEISYFNLQRYLKHHFIKSA
jgi:chromatin remodeling complex protein RSC6